MRRITFPSGIHNLTQLAERMAQGFEMAAPWLPMTQTDPAEFRNAVNVLRERQAEFARLRSEKTLAQRRMNGANEALTGWLLKARFAVMLACGVQRSVGWSEAGFSCCAMRLPKAIGPRIELARRIVDFFARNPQFGVAHANVTASHGRKLHDEIVRAHQVRRQLMSECNHARTVRDAAERKLRRTMRRVVVLLNANIKPSDPRWLAFGLNQPRRRESKGTAVPATPAAPITLLSPPEKEGAVVATAAA